MSDDTMTLNVTGKFAVPIGNAAVTVPGVYTIADKSAMVAPRGVPIRRLAIVASAKGGAVGGLTRVLRGDEGRILRGGVGAQMARAAFNHDATEILFVRVDKAVPALLDLGTGGLYAVNPGRASNALQGKTSPNSTRADAIDLFLKDASGGEQDETYRMIGPMLDITYVGSGGTPAGSVTREADGSVTLSLTAEGDASAPLTVNSNAVPTTAELVEAINRSGSWSAISIGNPATPVEVAEANPAITFTAGEGTLYGGARLVALVLRASGSRIARLALPEGAGTQGTGPGGLRVTGNYEFFSGGSDGPLPTANDFISALRLLEEVPVTGIVMGTDEPAALAALASHLQALSGVKERKERWGGAGLGLQVSKVAALNTGGSRALMFSDVDRMAFCINPPFDNDVATGRLMEQPACVAMAAALALKVINRPEEPLTFKALRFSKFRYSFTTEELEAQIEAGIMPMHYDVETGRNQIMSGITTYTADANVASRKLAAVDAIDYLNKKTRLRVTSLSIGKVADEARVKVVLQSVKSLLNEEVRSTRNPTGILTPGIDPETNQPVAAWRNLEAVFDGFDLVGVDYDANLVGEIAYVRVRPRFTPVRIEARA